MPPEALAEMDSYATTQEQDYAALVDEASALRKELDLLSGKMDGERERLGARVQDLDGPVELLFGT